MKLSDYQWINIGFQIPLLKQSGTLSGRLHRLLGEVFAKTEDLRNQFQEEFDKDLLEAGSPAIMSEKWVEVNISVSDSFKQTSSELAVPAMKTEWFDDVQFAPGQYEIFKPLFQP
ncbi:MAG TPA: hypothetical protein PKY12_12340 [Catalimonadaceae bacterium]|nr:hypothetical protein [Catalimonadaceae bacterium]